MAEEQEVSSEQVEEEFAVWKKNTPFLYDVVISHPLEWPSLTVHWVPLSSPPQLFAEDPSFAVHKLVLGTHTSQDFPNFLMIADVVLPTQQSETNFRGQNENPIIPKVEIKQKIHVDGEVNRARCMPQNPAIIGAKTSGCEVLVFDYIKQAAKQEGCDCDPDLRLRGHDNEGYGLSWSPFKEGYLLSGSHDHKICLWDVSGVAQDKVLDAMHVYQAHESLVEDVSWHMKNENLFGSAGDDCQLIIWDLRTNQPQHTVKAHEKEINYLSFNPYNEWVLATASSDSTVALFDLRKLTVPLHTLSSHEGEVFQVEWDPNHETVLASSADDRRLMVWDLNRIGDEQLELDAEDGPPELLFSHGGHKAKISEFSWNKYEPWVISSVADDNTLQVWQMAESIYRDDDDQQAVADEDP
ncbi:WD40 domain-containing protein/CAF1C_H4-bd domain-containing protein [Cephalotus follicularis]|uniref:WD40 domain-containing protein/CAF1C_H4-bd domain-containing protein n=1 Tax=Cephalotus follicularis TaxID=3775 RepID=A0A1Q3CR86_CEPFO|nr:WD40 domain-containing protein/CAF1C_H4-bd domain-containing protein [Cephalotus follicularis]